MHAHALRMRTEQSKDDSLAASVNRRAALVTAAALALELRSPAPAHAAGATMTMTVNTFEGVKGDVGTVLVCVLVCVTRYRACIDVWMYLWMHGCMDTQCLSCTRTLLYPDLAPKTVQRHTELFAFIH